VENGEVFIDI